MEAFVFLALLFLYFLPTMIAGYRDHREVAPIGVLNLFLGWTFLGWIAALVWSLTSNVRDQGSA